MTYEQSMKTAVIRGDKVIMGGCVVRCGLPKCHNQRAAFTLTPVQDVEGHRIYVCSECIWLYTTA
jgi:hypothetical protein